MCNEREEFSTELVKSPMVDVHRRGIVVKAGKLQSIFGYWARLKWDWGTATYVDTWDQCHNTRITQIS